jgi:hypothetical protein
MRVPPKELHDAILVESSDTVNLWSILMGIGSYLSFVWYFYLCETWHKTPVRLLSGLEFIPLATLRIIKHEQNKGTSTEENCDLS